MIKLMPNMEVNICGYQSEQVLFIVITDYELPIMLGVCAQFC